MDNDNLINKENIFEYSVENGILPILLINEEGIIIYHNKAVHYYTGEDNIKDIYIYRLSSDIKKDDWICLWNELKENDTYKFVHEFYNKKLDKIFTLDVLTNKVIFNDIPYCHMVLIDISELVETNLRLSKEKTRAEESERLKNAFLSNMSHEIRTPMNAIVGFSEILNDSIENRFKEYTKIITDNVDYLLSLIDNIIMISRIDSEQLKIKHDVFDLMDVMKDIYITYTLKLKKSDKKLKLVLDNIDGQLIESDRYIIEECLYRLIDNSIKFSIDGEIHIGFYNQDKNITIYVKDNGIGIENKLHEIIFDRFRQVNKQTIGAGLGLSIFKSFIQLLGGKYHITSKLNEGTLVSFTIKLRAEISNKSDDYVLDDTNIDKLKSKRILVAEDLEVNQLLIHDMLLPYKINIIKCMDGRETIEKFTEIKDIDLILMDLDMPYLDGYEATKIIRTKDKVIPIIAQTAYSQKENRERARRIGFNDFLTKPITKDKLIKIILKYL